jgi:hypothetical protein
MSLADILIIVAAVSITAEVSVKYAIKLIVSVEMSPV